MSPSPNDPNSLYNANRQEQLKIYNEAVRKSLDIPKSDDMIAVDNSQRNGFGWKEMLAAGVVLAGLATGGAGAAGILAYVIANLPDDVPQVQEVTIPSIPEHVPLEDREYEIIHYDSKGNQIDVQPYSAFRAATDDDADAEW